MPIIMKVDHERKEVDCVAVGPISYADVVNHLLMERNFKGLAYREFIDARGAGLLWTPEQARQIVGLHRAFQTAP
jgi:hypothetical protein